MRDERDPTTELLRWLEPNPSLPDEQRAIAGLCHMLATDVASRFDSSAELTAGLRKLLEAKDCFVRASLR
jgi:hypothetical protein